MFPRGELSDHQINSVYLQEEFMFAGMFSFFLLRTHYQKIEAVAPTVPFYQFYPIQPLILTTFPGYNIRLIAQPFLVWVEGERAAGWATGSSSWRGAWTTSPASSLIKSRASPTPHPGHSTITGSILGRSFRQPSPMSRRTLLFAKCVKFLTCILHVGRFQGSGWFCKAFWKGKQRS